MKLQIIENEENLFFNRKNVMVAVVTLNKTLGKLSRFIKESRNLIKLNKLSRYYFCNQRKQEKGQ